jgi:hypothetical protein
MDFERRMNPQIAQTGADLLVFKKASAKIREICG